MIILTCGLPAESGLSSWFIFYIDDRCCVEERTLSGLPVSCCCCLDFSSDCSSSSSIYWSILFSMEDFIFLNINFLICPV